MEAPSSTSMSAVSSRSPFSVSYCISCRDSSRSSPRRDGSRSSPRSPFPLPSGSPSRFRSRGPTILAGRFWVGFAAAEAMASIVFAGLVFGMWRRSSRRRPAASFSVLGGGWLVLGSFLAVYMAVVPGGTSRWLPAHGWIVLLGFATFEICGLIPETLLPYVTGGLRAWRLGVRAQDVFAPL